MTSGTPGGDGSVVAGLTVTTDGVVARIVLDRPERRNALTQEMVSGLIELISAAAADDSTRVIVLRGAAGHFCAGMDLAESNEARGSRPRTGHLERRVGRLAHRLVQVMLSAEVPIVTAVEGWAAGLGNVLALSGDFIVAAENARFWAPFVGRGFTADSGTTWLLPRLVGLARAKDMIMRARPVNAPEALAWGLVNQVVEAGELDAAVQEATDGFAASPTVALGLTKALLLRNADVSLDAALYNEALAEELSVRSADFKEGMAAFAEHRPPRYRGW